MKKVFSMLICVLFAAGFIACQQQKEAAGPAGENAKESASQTAESAAEATQDAAEQAAEEERKRAAEMIGESSVEGAHH